MKMIKTRDAICSKLYRYGGDIGDRAGATTGQICGWSPSLGFVSLVYQTP